MHIQNLYMQSSGKMGNYKDEKSCRLAKNGVVCKSNLLNICISRFERMTKMKQWEEIQFMLFVECIIILLLLNYYFIWHREQYDKKNSNC